MRTVIIPHVCIDRHGCTPPTTPRTPSFSLRLDAPQRTYPTHGGALCLCLRVRVADRQSDIGPGAVEPSRGGGNGGSGGGSGRGVLQHLGVHAHGLGR